MLLLATKLGAIRMDDLTAKELKNLLILKRTVSKALEKGLYSSVLDSQHPSIVNAGTFATGPEEYDSKVGPTLSDTFEVAFKTEFGLDYRQRVLWQGRGHPGPLDSK